MKNKIYRALRPVFVIFSMVVGFALPLHAQETSLDSRAMVQAHNRWRAEVDSPSISWSDELANKAEKWAQSLQQEGCAMRHSGPGQNLYWAGPKKSANSKDKKGHWIWQVTAQDISPQEVVDAWAAEKKWYDPQKNKCRAPMGRSCGHYTQVIWAESTEVGCAYALCDDQSQIWVCNYRPAGNIVGQKPF